MEGEIALENYKVDIQKCVPQGRFGTFFRGIDINTSIAVYITSIECNKKASGVKKDLEQLVSKLEHPNIIPLLKVYSKGSIVWTIHGNDADMSLSQYLSTDKKLGLEDIFRIIHQLVSAVNFLHCCKPQIIHADIQTNNIFLRNGKETDAMLAGCGDSEVLGSHGVTHNGAESEFRAPEIIANEKHTMMSDVFSVGAVMLVLILQDGVTYPRSDIARTSGTNVTLGVEMYHRNNLGLDEVTVVSMSDDDRGMVKFCKQLIIEMTNYKPSSRMALGEVEPLFEQVTEKKIVSGKDARGKKQQGAEAKPLITVPPKSPEPMATQLDSIQLGSASDESQSDIRNREGSALRRQSEDPMAAILALMGLLDSSGNHVQVDVGDYAIFAATHRQKISVKSQTGDGIAKYLGAVGQLIERKESKHFKVQFADGLILSIEDTLLKKIDGCPWKFRKGDLVLVSPDGNFVERESKGHGGWTDKMILIIGEKGVVEDIDKDGDIHVNGLNGLSWWLNPSVLTKLNHTREVSEGCFVVITIDFVRIRKIQTENDVWDDNMQKVVGCIGQVKKIHPNNLVDVDTGIGMHTYHNSVVSFVADDDEVSKLIYLRTAYERKELKSIACVIS